LRRVPTLGGAIQRVLASLQATGRARELLGVGGAAAGSGGGGAGGGGGGGDGGGEGGGGDGGDGGGGVGGGGGDGGGGVGGGVDGGDGGGGDGGREGGGEGGGGVGGGGESNLSAAEQSLNSCRLSPSQRYYHKLCICLHACCPLTYRELAGWDC